MKPGRGAARPQSYLWVGQDDPAKRLKPHEALLALEIDPREGATVDIFVERGGKEFSGLAVQAIRVRGLKARAQLAAGVEIIDPPPSVVGIGTLGGPARSGVSEIRRVAAGTGTGTGTGTCGDDSGEAFDEEAEAAAPDDDPELGDIETYRRRRAEEGRREPHEADPDLDAEAVGEAESAAASERVLIFPGQAYEVESIRLRVIAIRGETIELDVAGRCAAVGEDGAVGADPISFGGKVFAQLEVA